MKFKVLLCFCVLNQIKQVFSTKISVHLGSSVALPCSVHLPDHDELLSITWSFNGSVTAFTNQTEREQYLNASDSGIIELYPLTVHNATPQNQGVYECHVKSALTSYFSNVTLIILVPPSVSVSSSEVVLGRKSKVECWAKGFSPSNITFSWTQEGNEIRAPQKIQTNITEDGLYEGFSQLVFIPELADQNTTYACLVNHETLEKPIVKEFRINITILPKVTVSVVPSSRSSPLTLTCEINGFYPQNISIQWIRNGTVLSEAPEIQQNNDGTYKIRHFHTIGVKEREQGGQVQCVAQQPDVSQPAWSSIDPSATDLLVQKLVLTKSAKASVAMMVISLILVLLLCFGFSWKRRDEKQKGLSVSCIILPPRVVVGQKGRVTISIEGRRADQVHTAWFLNDAPIIDTSYREISGSRSHTPRTSRVSILSEKSSLLAFTAPGYYKLHMRKPLHSTGPIKQLLSSFTFIPNLSIHKGAIFKCQISYKGKDNIVLERVSEKFTILSPPTVSEIQLSKPNEETGIVIMTVEASNFHPDVITFRWFCEGGELCPVATPSALAAPRPDSQGFFSARSQCRLPKSELERGETAVWVTVHHISLKQPITRKTRGFIKTPNVSEISCNCCPSSPQDILTLACSITSFYPPDIAVKWLKRYNNGEMEIKNEEGLMEVLGPIQTQPWNFRAMAMLTEVENRLNDIDKDGEIVCRVEHCSLLEPIERVWTNSHFVAPSIPASLSVTWNNDGVGIFSLCLFGGVPHPKLQWAAGGSTLTPLISTETEKVIDKEKRELHSLCALMKSAVPQSSKDDFHNLQNGHLNKSQFPVLQCEAKNGMDSDRGQEKQTDKAAVIPEFIDKTIREAEPNQFESFYINTVCVGKEGSWKERECLRVTVEITHPAFHLPVYCTWTEHEEEQS